MSTELAWFKSSYSNTEGGACVEVAVSWRKSSYSNTDGGNCVEVAACPHSILVRDSKQHSMGPQVAFTAGAWSAFVASVRSAA
ncbi:DUF397 domain-containing protein [Streptomyces tubbatahanensis]|uniref:DUF397 domain-containing protein n=1 Tax=Streptomyces tubbatahanensis TaxID=2923272 RepID=A0ABY3XVW3_9ACTN|nr:DUF397 domain-containing protein [Streptomyces tubbatahanensis]UNS98515.1 DUF397 domain-containing protein [Streptomyces tubbatahanensis]